MSIKAAPPRDYPVFRSLFRRIRRFSGRAIRQADRFHQDPGLSVIQASYSRSEPILNIDSFTLPLDKHIINHAKPIILTYMILILTFSRIIRIPFSAGKQVFQLKTGNAPGCLPPAQLLNLAAKCECPESYQARITSVMIPHRINIIFILLWPLIVP
jgi:hypothetical protein